MIRIISTTVLFAIAAFQLWFPLCLAQAEEALVYDPKGQRDPFVPLVSKEGVYRPGLQIGLGKGIMLEGILWDPEGKASRAIVNGEIMKEGDEFGDLRLLKIERERIHIMIHNKVSEIELFPEEAK